MWLLALCETKQFFFTSRPLSLTAVAAMLMTFVEAVVYVGSGMYGPPSEIGFIICSLLVIQLFVAGVICILLVSYIDLFHRTTHNSQPYVGRAAAKGLRSGLWYLSLHRHQHLREYRVEEFLSHHSECGPWH